MGLEVDNQNLRRALARQADNLHVFVWLADGRDDVGIAHAGISGGASVLHAIAPDEGDVRAGGAAEQDARRLEVGQGRLADGDDLVGQGGVVGGVAVEADLVGGRCRADVPAGVRVRAGEIERLGRQTGGGGGALPPRRREALDLHEVEGDEHGGVRAVRERHGVGLSVVKDALDAAIGEVAGDVGAERRVYFRAGEAGLEVGVGGGRANERAEEGKEFHRAAKWK